MELNQLGAFLKLPKERELLMELGGGAVKRAVWRAILQGRAVIGSAEDCKGCRE